MDVWSGYKTGYNNYLNWEERNKQGYEPIKADLEGMKKVGLRGTYLMPIRGTSEKPEYEGKAQQLTPEFWDVVEYALHCADSLNLELGVHICDGFALAGGPWFSEEESMQKIVWNEEIVTIPAPKNGKRGKALKVVPDVTIAAAKGAQDIFAFAVPVDYSSTTVTPINLTFSEGVTSNEKNIVSANAPCWFTFEFNEGAKIRNVEIFPVGTNIQCQRLKVEGSEDGKNFTYLTTLQQDRDGRILMLQTLSLCHRKRVRTIDSTNFPGLQKVLNQAQKTLMLQNGNQHSE